MTLCGVIPEKELALGLFLALGTGGIDRLHGVRVDTGIEYLGAQGHGGGREVLYLLQFEVQLLGYYGKLCHILLGAAWVTAYEIRDKLLPQSAIAVNPVKCFLELPELRERRLAHKLQNGVGRMLRGYLEASAHVACDELFGVLAMGFVRLWVRVMVLHYVIAYSAANACLLYAGYLVGFTVKLRKGSQVSVKVRADLWGQACGALASGTFGLVTPAGSVHIGRRSSQVRYISLEVLHQGYLMQLFNYALLASAYNLFALMG